MSSTSEDNCSDECSGISENASLIRILRQQRNVGSQELEGDDEEDYHRRIDKVSI